MNDKKTSILVKYKMSMLIDQLLAFIPIIMYLSFSSFFDKIFKFPIGLGFFCFALLGMIFLLLSDIILLGRSMGKRIFKIRVCDRDSNKSKVGFTRLVYRRFLEHFIHPFFTKDFISKIQLINNITSTYIADFSK